MTLGDDNQHLQSGADGKGEEGLAIDLGSNPKEFVTELYADGFLDGLTRYLRWHWDTLSPSEIEDIVADTASEVYERLVRGSKITHLKAYALKVAKGKAVDYSKRIEPLKEYDEVVEEKLGTLDENESARDTTEWKRTALVVARSLLPRLGQVNVVRVMGYIFDAIEAGVDDLPAGEIASALGLSSDVVRQSMSRGWRRLERIAKEEQIIEDFDFLNSMRFSEDGIDEPTDED